MEGETKVRIVELGDVVTRTIATVRGNDGFFEMVDTQKTGKVIYVHPKGRFHTVEFDLGDGATHCESYPGIAYEEWTPGPRSRKKGGE